MPLTFNSNEKTKLTYLHISGWCIYSTYLYLINLLGDTDYKVSYVVGYVTVFAAGFYASLFCLRLFRRKRGIWLGPVSILLSVVLLAVMAYFYTYHVLPLVGINLTLTPRFDIRLYIQNVIRYYLQFFSLALLYFLFMNWLNRQKERMQMELAFLRAQINPHFLFNTLNLFYSQAQESSPLLADNINRLSQIMYYTVSNAEQPDGVVKIEDELYHLELLLELYAARFAGNLKVEYRVTGNSAGQIIPPLLLLTIVENAAKYGDLTDPDCPLSIHVKFEPELIQFSCSNKKLSTQRQGLRTSSPIGLRNLRRRMDISFKNSYEISIDDNRDIYQFSLIFKYPANAKVRDY